MLNIDKKSEVKETMNTDLYLDLDNDLICFYVNNKFVKSMFVDTEGQLKLQLDYEYILNTDLDKFITDELSFRAIHQLRYKLAKYDGLLNEQDRLYLKSINYENYYDDVSSDITTSSNDYLELFFQLLLCTRKHLMLIGVPSESLSNIQRRLKTRGYAFKPNKGIANLDENTEYIKELDEVGVRLELESLYNKKEELRVEMKRVLYKITQVEKKLTK